MPVLDGGPCAVGIESTVLSLATTPATLLRPGMIPRDEIEAITGPLAMPTAGHAGHAGPHASPGLHERHYQSTLCIGWLAEQSEEAVRQHLYQLKSTQSATMVAAQSPFHSLPRKLW